MTNTDLPELAPDALARIEDARTASQNLIRAARADGDQIWRSAADFAIGSDSDLFCFASGHADSVLVEAQNLATIHYFDVMTYEYFAITPVISEFESLLEKLSAKALQEFGGDAAGVEARKREWRSRALGRSTLKSAATDRTNGVFWRDIEIQFRAFECPHVYAVPRNGWWSIGGLSNEPFERDTFRDRFHFAVSRAVAGLGFSDRLVDLSVWLDLLAANSTHYLDRCINNLCLASAEYCTELLARSELAKQPESPKADPGQDDGRDPLTAAVNPPEGASQSLVHASLDGPAPTAAEVATRQRRREVLKRYRLDKELETNLDLARHLGMSQTAIEGIVRGDRTRYGKGRLLKFLEKIGVPPEEW